MRSPIHARPVIVVPIPWLAGSLEMTSPIRSLSRSTPGQVLQHLVGGHLVGHLGEGGHGHGTGQFTRSVAPSRRRR